MPYLFVLQFHALQIDPSIFCPDISRPAFLTQRHSRDRYFQSFPFLCTTTLLWYSAYYVIAIPSVSLSVCHMGGSVINGVDQDQCDHKNP